MEKFRAKIRNVKMESKFTVSLNEIPEDPELSWGAKGLLWYILSQRPDWSIYTWELSHIFEEKSEGRDAVINMMKELQEASYMIYSKKKDEIGQWYHSFDVYPTKMSNLKEKYIQKEEK